MRKLSTIMNKSEREIKFRIWDELNKCFIFPESPSQQHFVLSLKGDFYNLQNGSGGIEEVLKTAKKKEVL